MGETGGKTTGVKERGVGETRAKEWEVGETGAKETGGKGSGQNVMEGIERKSYSAAVIEGVRKRARVFVGDSIDRKYRQLVRTLKQTRVEQVILSGILPVMGRRGHKYRNCRGMAINMLVQKLCKEEEVGFMGKFFWEG